MLCDDEATKKGLEDFCPISVGHVRSLLLGLLVALQTGRHKYCMVDCRPGHVGQGQVRALPAALSKV